jgi:hypothetical protein
MNDDKLMLKDNVPISATAGHCGGCSYLQQKLTSRGMCDTQCIKAAMRQNLDNPGSYYYFDPLVYATNRLKGLV